jgi:hypothetical protein
MDRHLANAPQATGAARTGLDGVGILPLPGFVVAPLPAPVAELWRSVAAFEL